MIVFDGGLILVLVIIFFVSLIFLSMLFAKVVAKKLANGEKNKELILGIIIFILVNAFGFFGAFIYLPIIGGVLTIFDFVPIIIYFAILIMAGLFLVHKETRGMRVASVFCAVFLFIALFFIFLPIMNPPPLPPTPGREISNAISSLSSGKVETNIFNIERQAVIRSSQFADKGIDECSFYFDRGKFSENQIDIGFDEDLLDGCDFYLANLTSSSIHARAQIFCGANADDLEIFLETVGVEIQNAPTDVWRRGEDYVGFDKVCVVILQRTS